MATRSVSHHRGDSSLDNFNSRPIGGSGFYRDTENAVSIKQGDGDN